jgi:hypothetical protein
MKTKFDNESGISYVWFQSMIITIIVIFGWMGIVYSLNLATVPFNTLITKGMLSQQTITTATTALSILGAYPILLIIGIFLNGVVTAANSRNTGMPAGGTQAFGYGAVIMLVCFVLAFVLSLAGGLLVDTLEANMMNQTLPIVTKLPAVWKTAQNQTVFFINLLMFIPHFIQILGGVIYFQSILSRTSGSSYSGGYYG